MADEQEKLEKRCGAAAWIVVLGGGKEVAGWTRSVDNGCHMMGMTRAVQEDTLVEDERKDERMWDVENAGMGGGDNFDSLDLRRYLNEERTRRVLVDSLRVDLWVDGRFHSTVVEGTGKGNESDCDCHKYIEE